MDGLGPPQPTAASAAAADAQALLCGIDQGLQDHMAWNQRLLRCALLRENPGEDVLAADAHQRCRLGRWLLAQQPQLAHFDAQVLADLQRHHQAMHGAVRLLCQCALRSQPARLADLQAYEREQAAMVTAMTQLRQRLAEAVQQQDALTGLPLRNGLDYVFDLRRKDAVRLGVPLYLAMADVDHFKQVNDRYGHSVGDEALRHLAALMRANLRENDVLVRYGGEEFLLLLLGVEAEAVVQRLLQRLRAAPLRLDDGAELALTMTVGLARVGSQDTLQEAIDRADRALLAGKQAGRDRYVVAAAA
jgi:diguanylate cyclase (GGDEF)-like protein